jgi:hypothetical protein
MKKSLLLFCFAYMAGILAYSQSLQLSDSTGPIANNATILKQGLPDAEEIVSFVFIKNNTANPKAIKVKKVEVMAIHGTTNVFCWGLCYSPDIFVSPDSIVVDAGATNTTDFSGHYSPVGVVGISTIRYVFFDIDNPTDTVCVNINFSTYPQGIKDMSNVSLSSAYPNPANNSVSFNCSVPQNSDAKLLLRNVLGSVVREIDINGNSGKLNVNTSDLADGVYFYTFLVNGNSEVTKKLVIRH